MTLHVLEDVICRVNRLRPDDDGFLSECSSLSRLIVRGRIDDRVMMLPDWYPRDLRALQADCARELIEGLIIIEALLAVRVGRPASFSNIVHLVRAPYKGRLKDDSAIDKAALDHLQASIENLSIPDRLRPLLRNYAARRADDTMCLVLNTIGVLLEGGNAW